MIRETTRMAVWPRDPIDGPEGKVYRYVVVGMIVTSEPLPGLAALLDAPGISEAVVDYTTEVAQLGPLLDSLPKRPPRQRLGDASDVLLSLKEI